MPLLPGRPFHALLMAAPHLRTIRCSGGTNLPSLLPRRLLFADDVHLLHLRNPRPASRLVLCSNLSTYGITSSAPVILSGSAPNTGDANDPAKVVLIKEELKKHGIRADKCSPGHYWRLVCPQCEGGSQKEKSLALYIRPDGNMAFWTCFRAKCGWKDSLKASGKDTYQNYHSAQKSKAYDTRVITEESLQLEPLCEQLVEYFSERMISAETLRRNAVMQRRYNNLVAIAFTYRRNGNLVNCKYRDITKKFWQEKDTERIFYGLDDIQHASDIIIVEGEIDKLSLEEAGYRNCVSVPDGAPAKVSEAYLGEEKDNKFQFLWNCKEYLNKASRIILATDADGPGQALAEELARRLGKERCWRVKWPMKNSTDVCKDANEVLMFLGPDSVRETIENAELYPIMGLFSFCNFYDEIDAYYRRSYGYELGVSTGWKTVDELYKVMPGELTVITGVPNSGKSEWIDALLCNLNKLEGWTFVLCSMENKVKEHARKLLEKYHEKPFFNASYSDAVERISPQELEQGKEWLNKTFYLIRCEDDCLPSVEWVLQLARAAVLRHGVRGLLIDPYNELDHQRPPTQTETEYVSQMLTKIKRFANHYSCHVWFVAHPRQLQQWEGSAPNLYDISGSAHFINKCDNGIVIHRNRDAKAKAGPSDRVEVCVRKVRNKVVGRTGQVFLSYDRVTGRYFDLEDGDSNNQSKSNRS